MCRDVSRLIPGSCVPLPPAACALQLADLFSDAAGAKKAEAQHKALFPAKHNLPTDGRKRSGFDAGYDRGGYKQQKGHYGASAGGYGGQGQYANGQWGGQGYGGGGRGGGQWGGQGYGGGYGAQQQQPQQVSLFLAWAQLCPLPFSEHQQLQQVSLSLHESQRPLSFSGQRHSLQAGLSLLRSLGHLPSHEQWQPQRMSHSLSRSWGTLKNPYGPLHKPLWTPL